MGAFGVPATCITWRVTTLDDVRRNWEGLAAHDALWSIAADPTRRESGWKLEEFYSPAGAFFHGRLALLGRHLDWGFYLKRYVVVGANRA